MPWPSHCPGKKNWVGPGEYVLSGCSKAPICTSPKDLNGYSITDPWSIHDASFLYVGIISMNSDIWGLMGD